MTLALTRSRAARDLSTIQEKTTSLAGLHLASRENGHAAHPDLEIVAHARARAGVLKRACSRKTLPAALASER